MSVNKIKLFTENFLVYGFGGVISKLIPLIMVPIVTRIMPGTEYYGISDMSNTIVNFASAFALMGMYDAMYRMFFEKDEDEYKKKVCSTALSFTICTSVLVFVLLIIFRDIIALWFFKDSNLAYVVYLSAMSTLLGATNSIVSAPTRMQNKRRVYLVANTMGPIISYSIAIPLLLAGHYIIALPLSSVISAGVMEITFGILNKKWFSLRLFDRKMLKQLLVLAIPVLPNFLMYWIFNSCDRLMITNMLGLEAAGVYSVGAKLGQASQLIYVAFAGGWQYFAFSTMKEKNQVKTNSLVYEYLGVASFVATCLVCAFSNWLFKVLFSEEYIEGYIVAPYLFMAPLLLMLYQTGNNQFLVIKKTWPGMFILASGVIVNVLLNWLLIPVIGIEGAAIATLMGYVVTDIIDIIVLIKCRLMKPRFKFLVVVMATIVFFVVWRLFFDSNIIMALVMWLLYVAFVFVNYKQDIVRMKQSIMLIVNNRKKGE